MAPPRRRADARAPRSTVFIDWQGSIASMASSIADDVGRC
jgi:hypothetical protein